MVSKSYYPIDYSRALTANGLRALLLLARIPRVPLPRSRSPCTMGYCPRVPFAVSVDFPWGWAGLQPCLAPPFTCLLPLQPGFPRAPSRWSRRGAAGGLQAKGRKRKASRAAKRQVREARSAETTEQAEGRHTTLGALKNKLQEKIQKIQVGFSKTVIEAARAIHGGGVGG